MLPYILTEYDLRLVSVTRSTYPTRPPCDADHPSPTEPCAGAHEGAGPRTTRIVYVRLDPGPLGVRMHLCEACLAALPVRARTYTDETGNRPVVADGSVGSQCGTDWCPAGSCHHAHEDGICAGINRGPYCPTVLGARVTGA